MTGSCILTSVKIVIPGEGSRGKNFDDTLYYEALWELQHIKRENYIMKDILNQLTLSEGWKRSLSTFPDYNFLGYAGGKVISYLEAGKIVSCLQEFLFSRGIKSGDKVALVSESRPEWGLVYLAVTTMGAAVVPVMVDFTEEQIGNILTHSDSRFLFASEKVQVKLSANPLILKGQTAVLKDFSIYYEPEGRELFAEGLSLDPESGDAAKNTASREVAEDDLAAILYTSGTTGVSKGVMLTHKNISHNAMVGIPVADVIPGDCFLSVLPLAHSYECSLGFILPMLAGAEIRYLSGIPSPRNMLAALEKVRPQQMLTVPLLMEKIFRTSILPKLTGSALLGTLYKVPFLRKLLHRFAAGKKLKALFGGYLKFFGIGGAPLAPEVEQFLRDARFPYSVGYGLTETAPCLAGGRPEISVFRAIGPAFRDVELRIADINPATGHGEVQARGPNVMKGYYKDPEKTAEVFTRDEWFKTGDLGFLDKQGILFIKGRLKNMILGPNGENIYPEEIEAVINRNPFVADSLVTRMGNSLVGRVHLNTEKIDEFLKTLKASPEELARIKSEILESIRKKANDSLNVLSRLSELIEQVEPFEKTPSLKIKRFLYT